MDNSTEHFRYLSRKDVVAALEEVDIVQTVTEALRLHARNEVVLPEEAYLPWQSPSGDSARCLAMPGALRFDDGWAIGLKTINGSLGNPARGLPRSQGFTLLLDPETARPTVLFEAAYISALRTAAVTAVAARTLAAPGMATMALIGCGTLAEAHLTLLIDTLPSLREVRLFDVHPERTEKLLSRVGPLRSDLDVRIVGSAKECVIGADLIVPVTTVTEGYIPFDWLSPGALVSHVSLDDLLPDVITHADLLVVDDWELVGGDSRRLLGRMYRSGELLDPSGAPRPGTGPKPNARKVDATIGEIVSGSHPGRRDPEEIIVCNAFGMAILDIAVAHRAAQAAESQRLGISLPL